MPPRFAPLLFLALVATAGAQEGGLATQTGGVTVKVVNGTTGAAGDAEQVELREFGAQMRLVASAGSTVGEVTFPGVDLTPAQSYLAVAVREGVEYRAQLDGQKLLDGDAITVHVFDQTASLAGVGVSGLNIMVRRRASGCELEYVVTVENASRPPCTIAATGLPVRLALPDLTDATAEVYGGPQPIPLKMASVGSGLVGMPVALVPGKTRIVLKGYWDVPGPASLEIGANLPVAAWNLAVCPATLAVLAPELSHESSDDPAFAQLRGPALAVDQRLRVTLPALTSEIASAGMDGPGATTGRPVPQPRPDAPRQAGPRWFWSVGAVVSVLLVGLGLWQRRR